MYKRQVGHVLDDAAVEILRVRGGESEDLLHVGDEVVLDVAAERGRGAGDADEGDDGLEEIVDVEGVGDVVGEHGEDGRQLLNELLGEGEDLRRSEEVTRPPRS